MRLLFLVAAVGSPYVLLAIATFFWAGNIVLARSTHTDIPPIAMAFWRWSIALSILLPFVFREIKTKFEVIVRHWKKFLILGITGAMAFNTMTYVGLNHTTATNAVILNSLIPVFIIIMAYVFLKDEVSFTQIGGCFISLVGMLAIVSDGNFYSMASLALNVGDFWIIAAMFCWAIYTILLRHQPRWLSPMGFLAVILILGLPVLLPFYIWELFFVRSFHINSNTFLTLCYFGSLPSVVSYILWNQGVNKIGPSRAGVFIHLVPVFGLTLSGIFLDESIETYHLIGASLIFLGIWGTNYGKQI